MPEQARQIKSAAVLEKLLPRLRRLAQAVLKVVNDPTRQSVPLEASATGPRFIYCVLPMAIDPDLSYLAGRVRASLEGKPERSGERPPRAHRPTVWTPAARGRREASPAETAGGRPARRR